MTIEQSKYESRLQRTPIRGKGITRFREVLVRHGLTVFMVAAVCLLIPRADEYFAWGLEKCIQYPLTYLLAALCLTAFLMGLTKAFNRKLNTRQIIWIFYLMGVSICEEWAFRLAIPGFTTGLIGLRPAILLCNLAFAVMHYFTLRWKIRWCGGAFFGAMGLSRLMGQGDLVLVIGVHWLVTFLNNPVPVGSIEYADN